MGVASKPVEPRPLFFTGFLTYGKRKFVDLKLIGALLWKLLIFQFYTAIMYTAQFGIDKKKARGYSKVMANFTKNLFHNL